MDSIKRNDHRAHACSFHLYYRCIDNLIVFKNKKFGDFVKKLNPSQQTVKKANNQKTGKLPRLLMFIMDIDNGLSSKLNYKVNGFNFHIVNFLFLALLVQEPNSENCLDLIFAAPPCQKDIIVLDINYITSAIRKFMLDMPSPSSFQNKGLLI